MKQHCDYGVGFFYIHHVGLVTVWFGAWSVHIFPWSLQVGHNWDYDDCESWGFGPLLLVCRAGERFR